MDVRREFNPHSSKQSSRKIFQIHESARIMNLRVENNVVTIYDSKLLRASLRAPRPSHSSDNNLNDAAAAAGQQVLMKRPEESQTPEAHALRFLLAYPSNITAFTSHKRRCNVFPSVF